MKFADLLCALSKQIEYIAYKSDGWVKMFINPTKNGLVFVNTIASTGFCAIAEEVNTKQFIVCFKARDFPSLYSSLNLVKI